MRNRCLKLKDKLKTFSAEKDFRRARNKANIAMKFAKSNYFNSEFVKSFKTCSLWKTVDKLTGYRSKPKSRISSVLDPYSELSCLTSMQFFNALLTLS
jgi:hypothetical protein